jgi:2-polyprenyl-3-methyl-5-hydroxy-6-metoxy-1,4-benzoquinol methylase
LINTSNRSNEKEIMDDFSMKGELLQHTLDQIGLINKRLGGNKITINGLKQLLRDQPGERIITILDIGCGSGEMLELMADYGRKNGYHFKLIGIDANEFTVNYARKRSSGYPEISYLEMDIMDEGLEKMDFDILTATLFLHHFSNDVIGIFLGRLIKKAGIGIVINDLHRSRTAWFLFKLISLFISNPMVRNDGATSVLRGFKKQELITISKKIPGRSTIKWKWAFRYQWIIKRL